MCFKTYSSYFLISAGNYSTCYNTDSFIRCWFSCIIRADATSKI